MSTAVRKFEVSVCKTDTRLGLVFGYALICAEKNAAGEFEPYFDQGSVDEVSAEKTAEPAPADKAEGDAPASLLQSTPCARSRTVAS